MTDHTVNPEDDKTLTQNELADRWQVTVRTLQNMRKQNRGPAFVLIGNALRYRLSDVVAFEEGQLRQGGKVHNRITPIMGKDDKE